MRHADAEQQAFAVMAAHIAALNAREEDALAATLHFPHYRLAGHRMTVWETSETYMSDFRARAGGDWDHSEWTNLDVIVATEDKVHLDVTFNRCRADGSIIGQFRSLWIITRIDGIWAAQCRSSFAPK